MKSLWLEGENFDVSPYSRVDHFLRMLSDKVKVNLHILNSVIVYL